MGDFSVVINVAEIKRFNRELARQLGNVFRHKEKREIGAPDGRHSADVYFEDDSIQSHRAWSHYAKPGRLLNLILSGVPNESSTLTIAVQLNFPADTYSRKPAGAFIKDAEGNVFLAHRGDLTKGKGRLKKKHVLREFASQLIIAEDDSKDTALILICSLTDPNLANRLCDFADEARTVAERLRIVVDSGVEPDDAATDDGATSPMSRHQRLMRLGKYFDEFAGVGETKAHGGGKRTVEHGDIVRALESFLQGSGESRKSQAIDLAVVTSTVVHLYEVKTSARTTDVYTGVGQLLIHGECIAELLGLPVRRYLVLPERPRRLHEPHIVNKCEICIMTFQKTKSHYRFAEY